LSAHFTIMLALIRMAARSFGANGSNLMRVECRFLSEGTQFIA